MNEKSTLYIEKALWQTPLRILSLLNLFISAYALMKGVLFLVESIGRQELSLLVVVIYLLVTPFCFMAVLFFSYAVYRMSGGMGADMQIVWGFAMMVLASVDDLIYISIHHEGDALSFYLLGGIVLICYIICFLYYQDIGNRALTLCASVLLTACAVLSLEEAVRYFASVSWYEVTGYYFSQTLLEFLLAVQSLLFLFALQKGAGQKKTLSH